MSQTSIEPGLWMRPIGIDVMHSKHSVALPTSRIPFAVFRPQVYPRAPRYDPGARSVDSVMKRTIGVIDPEITCSNCLYASA